MCKQAADAAMRAYRDGYTRQAVRIRIDAAFNIEDLYSKGTQGLLRATMPLAKSFTKKLWGGKNLRGIKASIVDNECSTLVYREADDAKMDAAVFYLLSRELVTAPKVQRFFEGMGDRLVILANTEQAVAGWRVENQGKDFLEDADIGLQVARLFKQQSYYYYQCPINNWQMTFFRVYPYPWEIYIEDLNYDLVKVGESEEKPDYDTIIAWMQEYEERNNILVSQKVGKFLKDIQTSDDAPSNPLML